MEEHDNSLVLTLKVVAAYVVWILLILEAVGVIPSSTTDGRYMCGIISFVLAYIFVPPLFQIVALGITALFHQKQR